MQQCYAQNINIDVSKGGAPYSTDFSKSFAITFKNTGKYKTPVVQLKTDADVPFVLTKPTNLKNYKIVATVTAGVLAIKDKDGNSVKITTGKFEIDVDELAFIITKLKPVVAAPAPPPAHAPAPAPAAVVNNDISFTLGGAVQTVTADFTKDIKVTIKGAVAGKKAKIEVKTTGTPVVINAAAPIDNFTMTFGYDADARELSIDDAGGTKFKVDQAPLMVLQDGNVIITINKAPIKRNNATGSNSDAAQKVPYWRYLGKANTFSLEDCKIVNGKALLEKCCDDCANCDDDAFKGNNQVIYDAKSGLTYFVPANENINYVACNDKMSDGTTNRADYRVPFKKKIVVNAGEPLVYIVENVNPLIYNLELSDSAFLTNNQSTGLLESLLLQKSENAFTSGTGIQGGDDSKQSQADAESYLKVKAGLLVVRAEMQKMLEYYRRCSPYLFNCIRVSKKMALNKINGFPKQLDEPFKSIEFLPVVDLVLNQETEDSTLNHEIKALYSEFIMANYKIAYRYPQVPEQDMLNFKLSIIAKPNSPYPSLLNVQMKHPTQTAYVKNFFKVDVSSGLYMGFMKDQTYTLRDTVAVLRNFENTADSTARVKRIIKQDDGKIEIGFASYLHLYYKVSTWFNPSLTLGAGISFDKTVRPRYFTGVSLLLGNNNRLCINGGIMWGNYEDISEQYVHKNGVYDLVKYSETINYATRFKHTGFISVSYNLPFLKRTSATEAKPKDNTAATPAP